MKPSSWVFASSDLKNGNLATLRVPIQLSGRRCGATPRITSYPNNGVSAPVGGRLSRRPTPRDDRNALGTLLIGRRNWIPMKPGENRPMTSLGGWRFDPHQLSVREPTLIAWRDFTSRSRRYNQIVSSPSWPTLITSRVKGSGGGGTSWTSPGSHTITSWANISSLSPLTIRVPGDRK